jgi:galactokinase
LDELVEIALESEGVLGSRMTGGGFGGSTVTLVSADKAHQLMDRIKSKFSGTASVSIFSASKGGGKISLTNTVL